MTADGTLTCVVTIHGIGFQQPPDDAAGKAGYADELHNNLKAFLGDALGEDPERPNGGAVYVASEYPQNSRDIEKGLERIDRPLAKEGASVAHVALVYSGDEEHVSDPVAGIILGTLGMSGVDNYASPHSLVKIFGDDWRGLFHRQTPAPTTSEQDAAEVAGSHSLTALVDHVGGYVARNVLRERVRVFVRDAVIRLAARKDIKAIVVNSHSNGTVIAFDVIPRIWPAEVAKLALFVTAGCPLRKYVYFMSWGYEIENWPAVRWLNYYDIEDLVADQLQPEFDKQMTGAAGLGGSGLFVMYEPNRHPIPVTDLQVDNVKENKHPHNYWANLDFCKLLADEVSVAAGLDVVNDKPRSALA